MLDGFLNLNKPPGFTSHDCVAKLRRLLGIKKIGHAGTLDPAATGVLPVAIGRATRLIQYLESDKAYQAVIRFGLVTTTDDLEGEICQQAPTDHLSLEMIQPHLPSFVGTLAQIPPRYSAIQVQGKRLYDLARRGETVDIPRRTVMVYALDVLDWYPGNPAELRLAIACGSGTYIRSIARDLGQVVGTGGTLAHLTRTRSSGFDLDDSLNFDALTTHIETGDFNPISPTVALSHLPQLTLTLDQANRWRNGQKIPLEDHLSLGLPLAQPLRVAAPEQPFIGIAMLRAGESGATCQVVVPKLVFHPEG
ncbi:MAG: tRNA pseudouridine(55) synthase TruB [Cyanobacteria bacterium J06642_9]